MVVERLSQVLSTASSPGGDISVSILADPSSAADWTNFAALYGEYRVLGMRVRWVPKKHNWVNSVDTSISNVLAYGIMRNATSPVPVTVDAAFRNTNVGLGQLDSPHRSNSRAGSAQEMLFRNTASPGAFWYYYLVANGASNGTVYGSLFVEWIVQFRART